VDGVTIDYWQQPALATPWNLTGSPALSVPAGLDDDGLPIGVQIVGPLWSELRLLEIARELERAGVLP
jgi:Asp-tRNA(Asn)/Glu-tRNA(Gln) amidotransferase A subunit family amidase